MKGCVFCVTKKNYLNYYAGPVVLFVVVLPVMYATFVVAALAATIASQIYYRSVDPTTSNSTPMDGDDFVTATR